MNFSTVRSLIMSARPATLTASIAPILVAYFLAWRFVPEQLNTIYLIPIFIAALCIQVATNLFNDYLDFFKGGDKEDRLGPTRVTAAGMLEPKWVKLWALGFCAVAFIAGVPLVFRGGALFLILGLICLAMTYLYTGTRFSLAYTGLADLFVIVFFGGVAAGGTYYLLTLDINYWVILIGIQLGSLCNILLLVNNLRDIDQDRQNNKNTLVVRFGKNFGVTEYFLLIAFAFGATLFWSFLPQPWLLFLLQSPLLLMSLYLWNWVRTHKPSKTYNKVLKLSSMIYLGFSLLCCVGLLVL